MQVSVLALAGKAKTKELQSSSIKYSKKQEQNYSNTTMKADQYVIRLQMSTNKSPSQSGMTAYGMRRHLHNSKNHILPFMHYSTTSLQMGTNKCARQVSMAAPETRATHLLYQASDQQV